MSRQAHLFPELAPRYPQRAAVVSPCRLYRYSLTRTLGDEPRRLVFVLLNPSTADGVADDRTTARCMEYARRRGFGVLELVNLFALRARNPATMKAHPDPVGPDCDAYLLTAAHRADHVVCGWGCHGRHLDRARAVVRLLAAYDLYALGRNNDGTPSHPLYIAAPWVVRLYATGGDYVR